MAKLKASEKRLLIIFLIGLFLVVNFFVYQEYASRYDRLGAQQSQLRLQKKKFEVMLVERQTWIDRRDWVVRRLPQYRTIDDRDVHLVNLVRNAAATSSLEIVAGPNPLPTKNSEHFEETLVNVTVDGEIEALVRFLHSLQDPEQFRSLTSMQMLPAKKDSSAIRCELTLAQWWSLEGPSVALDSEQDPGVAGEPPVEETPPVEEEEEPEIVAPPTDSEGGQEQSRAGQDEREAGEVAVLNEEAAAMVRAVETRKDATR